MKRSLHLGRRRSVCMACVLSATLCLLFALTTSAQVTVVPPFVGDHAETWERFGVSEIPDGTSILGGIATITGTNIVTLKSIVLCTVPGKPSDGVVFMFSDRPSGPLTISFSQPVVAFGAYWGSGYHCERCCPFGDSPSLLTFEDVNV